MAQLKEILEKEKQRAYEWSAWLCVRYHPDLKVTHRILKGGEDIVFVGFPLTSLDRYTPEGAVPHRGLEEERGGDKGSCRAERPSASDGHHARHHGLPH